MLEVATRHMSSLSKGPGHFAAEMAVFAAVPVFSLSFAAYKAILAAILPSRARDLLPILAVTGIFQMAAMNGMYFSCL